MEKARVKPNLNIYRKLSVNNQNENILSNILLLFHKINFLIGKILINFSFKII